MTKIICKARGAGKTTDAVAECLKCGGTFITFNGAEARRLKALYPSLDVVSIAHAMRNTSYDFAKTNPAVFVDNADMILENLLQRPVRVITVTSPKSARYDKLIKIFKKSKEQK